MVTQHKAHRAGLRAKLARSCRVWGGSPTSNFRILAAGQNRENVQLWPQLPCLPFSDTYKSSQIWALFPQAQYAKPKICDIMGKILLCKISFENIKPNGLFMRPLYCIGCAKGKGANKVYFGNIKTHCIGKTRTAGRQERLAGAIY